MPHSTGSAMAGGGRAVAMRSSAVSRPGVPRIPLGARALPGHSAKLPQLSAYGIRRRRSGAGRSNAPDETINRNAKANAASTGAPPESEEPPSYPIDADDEPTTSESLLAADSMLGTCKCITPSVIDSEEMLPPPKQPEKLFKMLGLDSMTEEEMEAVFNKIDKDGNGVLTVDEVEALVRERLCQECSPEKRDRRVVNFMRRFDIDNDGVVSHKEFSATIRDLANTIDRRVYTMAVCMGAVGFGTGLMSPVMPKIVEQLGLSVQDFGLATSAKGAAQMLSNFPAAWAVGSFGRVPMLAGGLLLMGLGTAGLTVAAGTISLAAARAISGAAASAISTSATAYVVDISNPLNRARSMASAFILLSLGLMLGPLVGGVLSSTVGVRGTLLVASGVFAAMAAIAVVSVPETLSRTPAPPLVAPANTTPGSSGVGSWIGLLKIPGVLDMVIVNFVHSAVQASAQITLLPVLLTTNLGFSPATVGSVFAGMAATGVVGSRFVAGLSDTVGSQRLVAPGSLLSGAAMILIPLVNDTTAALAGLVLLWAAGNTLSMAAPKNFVSINAPPEKRVQALAFLSTTGDLGFFVGGIVGGTAARMTSVPAAMGGAGIIMLTLAVLIQLRLQLQKSSDGAKLAPA